MADFELPPRRRGEDYNPFAAPESELSASPAAPFASAIDMTEAERIRNEHIGAEASIRAIGGLQIFGAVFLLIAGVMVMIAAASGPAENLPARIIMGLIYFGLGILGFFIGGGLRNLKNWARVTAAIMSIPGIFNPITWLILYYLLSKKGAFVCTPRYAEIRAMTPHIKYKTSIIVKFFVLLLVLVFVLIMIGLATSRIQ